MIESFRHKGLKKLFEEDDRSRQPAELVERIRDILATLDAAKTIDGMNRPSLKLHRLKGKLKEFWAVTVRANWRIIFRFEDGKARDVDFLDYH
jgi:toxin HigB-1